MQLLSSIWASNFQLSGDCLNKNKAFANNKFTLKSYSLREAAIYVH